MRIGDALVALVDRLDLLVDQLPAVADGHSSAKRTRAAVRSALRAFREACRRADGAPRRGAPAGPILDLDPWDEALAGFKGAHRSFKRSVKLGQVNTWASAMRAAAAATEEFITCAAPLLIADAKRSVPNTDPPEIAEVDRTPPTAQQSAWIEAHHRHFRKVVPLLCVWMACERLPAPFPKAAIAALPSLAAAVVHARALRTPLTARSAARGRRSGCRARAGRATPRARSWRPCWTTRPRGRRASRRRSSSRSTPRHCP